MKRWGRFWAVAVGKERPYLMSFVPLGGPALFETKRDAKVFLRSRGMADNRRYHRRVVKLVVEEPVERAKRARRKA